MAYPNPDRFYRTLIKVVAVELDIEGYKIFKVVIPSWGTEQISVLADSIPDDIRSFVDKNLRSEEDIWLIAKVNLSMRFSYALIFKDWEFAPKLVCWDEL